MKREHPRAAASRLEGIEELFTVNQLGLTPALTRCLASTNLTMPTGRQVENPNGRFRAIARNVTRWRDGEMIRNRPCVGHARARRVLRLWKLELQSLADEPRLALRVCHFPPGASKWNKIEHRMFCHITQKA